LKTGLRATPFPVSLLSFSLVVFVVAGCPFSGAQATPAATQPIHLSGFGGLTGAYTGLKSSRNLGLTAGVDVSFKPFYRLYPSAEIRGTYPVDSGTLAGERNFLAGLKLERPYRNVFHPYVDFLYGRNKIDYNNGGYPNPSQTLLYVSTVGNILALGGGIDVDLTPHFAAKLDAQYERYQTPVVASGDLNSVAITAGVVYRLDFNHHFHYDRRTDQVTNLPKQPAPRPVPPPPPPSSPAPDASSPPDATTPPPDAPNPPPDATTPPAAPAAAAPASPPTPDTTTSQQTPNPSPDTTPPTPSATPSPQS
jgi:hypothetical protein